MEFPEDFSYRFSEGNFNRKHKTLPANTNVAVSSLTKSQYTGVYRDPKHKRWNARITSVGKTVYLGSFDDETEAARAFDDAALRLHGKSAPLNFPVDSDIVKKDGESSSSIRVTGKGKENDPLATNILRNGTGCYLNKRVNANKPSPRSNHIKIRKIKCLQIFRCKIKPCSYFKADPQKGILEYLSLGKDVYLKIPKHQIQAPKEIKNKVDDSYIVVSKCKIKPNGYFIPHRDDLLHIKSVKLKNPQKDINTTTFSMQTETLSPRRWSTGRATESKLNTKNTHGENKGTSLSAVDNGMVETKRSGRKRKQVSIFCPTEEANKPQWNVSNIGSSNARQLEKPSQRRSSLGSNKKSKAEKASRNRAGNKKNKDKPKTRTTKESSHSFHLRLEESHFPLISESKAGAILNLPVKQMRKVASRKVNAHPSLLDFRCPGYVLREMNEPMDLHVSEKIIFYAHKTLNIVGANVRVEKASHSHIDYIVKGNFSNLFRDSYDKSLLDGISLVDRSRGNKLIGFCCWSFWQSEDGSESRIPFLNVPLLWLDNASKTNPRISFILILCMLACITGNRDGLNLAFIRLPKPYYSHHSLFTRLKNCTLVDPADVLRPGTQYVCFINPLELLYKFEASIGQLTRIQGNKNKFQSNTKEARHICVNEEAEQSNALDTEIRNAEIVLNECREKNLAMKLSIAESFFQNRIERVRFQEEYSRGHQVARSFTMNERTYDAIADVVCTKCGKDSEYGNLLVICDSCERGWHQKCHQGIDKIPEGEWICGTCLNSQWTSEEIACTKCGKDSVHGNLVVLCDKCKRGWHQNCHIGIDKIPQGEWACEKCVASYNYCSQKDKIMLE